VVDDHPVVRHGLVSLLSRSKGISVVAEAGAAKPAIELFRRHRPGVVITDLMLPDMDGISLTLALRLIDPQAHIVILSAFGSDVDVRKAVEAGAIGYLLKDVPDEELVQAVRRVSEGMSVFTSATTGPLVHALQDGHLTMKELEVLQLLAEGLDNREMGAKLNVSGSTLKSHVSNAMQKLGVHDRSQLIVMALRQGLVRVPGKR
jgi:DNA-binding NarL/FixJ family response regulator